MAIAVLNVSRKSFLYLIEKVRNIIVMMTGNANYTTPVPSLATVGTQTDNLETKYQEAIFGGTDKKALMRLARATLKNSVMSLTGYVQAASGGDSGKILSAGFEVKHSPSPAGVLPPPAGVRSKYGNVAGEIIAFWNGVPKRLIYRVQINDTPGDNTKWVDYVYTGDNRVVFTGLITDKVYDIRVATISAGGMGSWSDITSHKAF